MSFSQGYALVIGVGTQKYSPENDVPITVSDAESVNTILIDPRKCGYLANQVTLLTESKATKNDILGALDKLAGEVSPDDTAVVFFAGHGALGADDQYYLVSHDAQFDEVDDEIKVKPGTGVSQAQLLQKLRAIQSKRMLLIFNACHSGSLQPKSLALKQPKKLLGTLSLPQPTAAALLGTGEGRIIITACRPDQLSNYLPAGKLTFFAKALTDGLSGKATPSNGFISAFNLYTYIYDAVTATIARYKKQGLEQEPMITVLQGVGPFAVALHSRKSAGPSVQASEVLPEGKGVHAVEKRESKKWLKKIQNKTITPDDYTEGYKVINKIYGDVIGGHKIGTQIISNSAVLGDVIVSGGSYAGHDQIKNTGGASRRARRKRSS